MRDYGFNFEWYDKYCENLFAKGFEQKQEKYDVLTAFELFEHLPDPMEDVTNLVEKSNVIIFSTSLLPNPTPKISDWWYYSLDGGQHISFYTKKSLELLAKRFNLIYSGCGDFHIFAPKWISTLKIRFALRGSLLVNKLWKQKSLLGDDYKAITGREL